MRLNTLNGHSYSLADPINTPQDEGGINLGKALGAIYRQSWVIMGTTVLFVVIGGIKAASDTPIYRAQLELLAEPLSLESQVISSTTPESLSNRQDVVAVVPNQAKLRILESPKILDPIIQNLQPRYPKLSYNSLTNNLTLNIDEQNNIIQVSYQDDNKQQVQEVLEQVQDAYINFSLEARQSELNKGLSFVETQLPRLRSRVNQIQNRLQWLRQENNFIDPTMEAEQLSQQVGVFVEQRLDVQAQLNEAQLVAQNLEKTLSEQPTEKVTASALNTPRYEALLNKLQEIDTQIAQESAIFTPSSPNLQTLQQQRQQLVALFEAEAQRSQSSVQSKINELQARDRALSQTIARLNQRSKQLSEVTRQYTDLQRELEIASNNLNQFLTKREALGIDVAQRESPWEVLTPPSTPVASSASIKQNLVLGSALGLLLGIGMALGLDRLRNLLYSAEEVQEVTNLPLLGSIPFDKQLTQTSNLNLALSLPQKGLLDLPEWGQHQANGLTPYIVESFRSLYTNIRLLSPDGPINSLVVSSATAGEGKSTIAVNLAKAAAAMGKQVLLVDADLRTPAIDKSVWEKTSLGLTDLIHQPDLGIHEVVQQSPLEDRLFFLPSGQMPPDPSKLLASGKMQHLMFEMQTQFELVIYDTTILSGFTDAYLLATSTSGIILVTAIGQLKRTILEETMQNLTVSRTPILGIVVNGDETLS